MNILMIMADQFRADWFGCAGADFVDTPHIDAIAKRGVRFKNAVCNSPLCAPSRASIAAGVYPHRLGVMGNDENFPIDRTTYYQLLRKNGYRVGVIGKTDLHKPDHFYGREGDLPLMYHLGFTECDDTEGKMNAAMDVSKQRLHKYENDADIPDRILAGPYQRYLKEKGELARFAKDYYDRFNEKPVWYSDISALPSGDVHDSYIGQKSCEFLENVSDESPWHLFVSFVGPHDPWDAPSDYFDLYKDRQFPESIRSDGTGKPERIKKMQSYQSKGISPQDANRVKQHYAGMIKLIDDWVGKMLAVLDRKGLRDNTAIIFCADHGEMMYDHGLFQKSVMYEGALRVPLIIALPSAMEGREDDSLAEMVDLFPTILDLTGTEYLKGSLDGKSLLPVLSGGEAVHRECQFSELSNTKMIFDGRYKLIESENDRSELYDLENDRSEINNLIEEMPALARGLRTKMKKISQ